MTDDPDRPELPSHLVGDRTSLMLAVVRGMNATPTELRRLADYLQDGLPSLRRVMESIEENAHTSLASRYPQGRRYLLQGLPAWAGHPPFPGFADRPVTDLTLDALEALRDAVVAYSAAQTRRKARSRLTSPSGGGAQRSVGPRASQTSRTGAGAGEQTVRAARNISKALTRAGYLPYDSLVDLKAPKRPTPSRNPALQPDELIDYLEALLASPELWDPVHTALVWVLFRVLAARRGGILALDTADITHRSPTTVMLVQKGGGKEEMPLPESVVRLLDDMRPPGMASTLWLARPGRPEPLSTKYFELWSKIVHGRAWAAPHRLRCHCLRHSTAIMLRNKGVDSARISVYLGQKPKTTIGAAHSYLGMSSAEDKLSIRRAVYEAGFGLLHDWPELPENALLAEIPELRPYMMRPAPRAPEEDPS